MSWLTENQLRDLSPDRALDITCPVCDYQWTERVGEITARAPRATLYLDEVARRLKCKAHGCSCVGVKLAMTRSDDTSGFVGGMP